MPIRTIMVQLDVDAPARPRLVFAKTLADRFAADLIGFAAADATVFVSGDDSGLLAAELMRQRAAEIEGSIGRRKKEFVEIAGAGGERAWRGMLGDPTGLLPTHARAADLIVTGTPRNSASGGGGRTIDVGSVLLSAGRPVLIAADNLAPLDPGKIVVAWNDTREARRVVSDAMPFLAGASEVLVVTVGEASQRVALEGAEDVARLLGRHGVKARAELLRDNPDDVAQAISDFAREVGAELVVAGAYGHSRLREWAFGGVTRSLLADGSVHRLLSN